MPPALLRALAFLAILIQFSLTPASARESITLQLKWTHAFQFAGYYAAKELGYYDAAGLDVQFKEASPELNVVEEVISGRAQFGVGTSSLLLERNAGRPRRGHGRDLPALAASHSCDTKKPDPEHP